MLKIVKQKLVVVLFLASIFGAYRAKAAKLSSCMGAENEPKVSESSEGSIVNWQDVKIWTRDTGLGSDNNFVAVWTPNGFYFSHTANAVSLTHLMKAIISDSKTEALKLIEKSTPDEINWQNAVKFAALDYAVVGGDIEIAAALIKKGAEINDPGFPVLREAVLFAPQQTRKALVKLLLKNGANPNTEDCKGGTPFLSAVWVGCIDVLNELFDGEIKPKLTLKQKIGNSLGSCLFEAISRGSLSVVKFLVDHGADVNEQIEIGKKYYLDEWAEKFQKQLEIAKYLKQLRFEKTNQKTNQKKRKQFDGDRQEEVKKLKNNFGAVVLFVAGPNSGICSKK